MRSSGVRISESLSAPEPQFLCDVVEGLSLPQKKTHCKYLYDARGAQLFENICTLEEYYPTKAELEIMQARAAEMAREVGPHAAVIEPGSGAGLKTRLLLQALESPVAYIPIDIAREQLERTATDISREFPELRVSPVHADFVASVPLPPTDGGRRLIYFPGSTIGNFERAEALAFLKKMAGMAGPGGALLIGADRKKDPAVLEAAYNDRRGTTAEFNLNLLQRINRELGGNFDLDRFEHRAVYREDLGRIEMRLISKVPQRVRIAAADEGRGREFAFKQGEWIHTESSHKYTPYEFQSLLTQSGWSPGKHWTDSAQRFGVYFASR